jgi:hypothetical protein
MMLQRPHVSPILASENAISNAFNNTTVTVTGSAMIE